MITSIKVDGFKTLSGFALNLNPGLNVLVGPNGSGKTNIISFFEFLSRLVELGASEAVSYLGGAGAIFRRKHENSYEPTITAEIAGCFPFAIHFGDSGPRKSDKNTHVVYEYVFALLFSEDTIVFQRQSFKYRRTNSFQPHDESKKKQHTWDVDIQTELTSASKIIATVREASDNINEVFPFFRRSKKDEHSKELESMLAHYSSPSMSLPHFMSRFSPGVEAMITDLAGGQTFNIIPSKVKALEDSAKPSGISSDGSGLAATLYSLKKQQSAHLTPFFSIYPTRGPARLKEATLETLTSYFQLANPSIRDISITNDDFTNQLRVSICLKNVT